MSILEKELPFKGKNGKEYNFVQLEINDLIRYTRWIQFKPLRDAIDAQLPEDLKKEVYAECKKGLTLERVLKDEFENLKDEEIKEEHIVEKAFPLSPDSSVVRASYSTIEGIVRLMEISLEKQNLNPKEILDDDIIKDNAEKFLIFIGVYSKKKEDKGNPTNPNQK